MQFYGGDITDTVEVTLKRDLSFFKKKSNPGITAPSNLEYQQISNKDGHFLEVENYTELPNGNNSKNTLRVSEKATLYKLDTTDNKFYDESGNILENVTATDIYRSPGVYILSLKTKGSQPEKTIIYNTALKDTTRTPYIVRFQNTEKALPE
ncbi:hypothetical protein [Flavobacterium beibuense]|uniref:Uncharacterized protein n=1 Tax=Flavobacterium beibuense TaxID=657326 RepID=A0A444WBL7_9FLAO|nr:hypothetical protein [Flavobacterium beibuense]RYJ43203.1 hypothetical protein NU09_1541 [Flavobacterium beibuense]